MQIKSDVIHSLTDLLADVEKLNAEDDILRKKARQKALKKSYMQKYMAKVKAAKLEAKNKSLSGNSSLSPLLFKKPRTPKKLDPYEYHSVSLVF